MNSELAQEGAQYQESTREEHKTRHSSGLSILGSALSRSEIRRLLARENKTGRRPLCEQSALGVGDAAFCDPNTTATVEDLALGSDLAGLQRDGPD